MTFFNLSVVYSFVVAFSCVLWVISLLRKDASIVDRFWGMFFVFIAVCSVAIFKNTSFLSLGLLSMVTIWGLRLSYHIHDRNAGHSEDYRYQSMRTEHGDSFWWYSFFSVFLLQATLAFIIAAPLICVFANDSVNFNVSIAALGFGIWIIGFFFEVVGDAQLKAFKANPQNKGQLLQSGLWNLTRHPNYFGDALLWWGFYIISCSVSYGWITFFGPLVMTFFLRYVSGVSLLEQGLKKSKPGYEDYTRRVPAFVPFTNFLRKK